MRDRCGSGHRVCRRKEQLEVKSQVLAVSYQARNDGVILEREGEELSTGIGIASPAIN